MKSLFVAFVILASASNCFAQNSGIPSGNWMLTALIHSGKPLPLPAGVKLVVTNDQLNLVQAGKAFAEYSYKTDNSKSPKWIDLTLKGEKSLGIYEVKDGTLKIHTNAVGTRATTFESTEASKTDLLMIFKLAK